MSTESFESVASSYGDFTWIGRDGVKAAIDRLKAAHDREIRDTAQQQYHRGFEAGQHSMDAEHRAVAMRLRGLRFNGGSHENLSRIAYAIYPCATGWTCESAAGLRDKLVDLMGGASKPSAADVAKELMGTIIEESNYKLASESNQQSDKNGDSCETGGADDTCDSQCCGACAADCGDGFREQTEVGDGRAADDSGADTDCGDGGGAVHMDGMTYDELWNERRNAVCELRKMTIDSDYHSNYQRIALAIGTVYDGESFASECVRDRLIHLLGGDQPSGIDVLNGADLSKMSVDAMSKRAMDANGTCQDNNGTCPNDVPTSSITDELREFVGTFSKRLSISVAEVNAIADRIDAQFDRICQQQEDVLQETIDEMVSEIDKMRKEVIELRKQRHNLQQECDELQAKLDELEKFDVDTSLAAFGDDNNELRRLLSRAATLLANAEQDRDANYAYWMDCKEKVVHANATIEELQAKLDAITAALNG